MSDDMLTLYTSTVCQPCNTAKKRLQQAGVPFKEVNIQEDGDELARLKTILGTPTIDTPLIRWQGRWRQIDAVTEIIREHKEAAA